MAGRQYTGGDGKRQEAIGVFQIGPNGETIDGTEYETVAASATAQPIGATGAAGDTILGILAIPATVSPGVITLLDGATSIPVFIGGANSIGDLKPFPIPLGLTALGAGWKITTGANISCIVIGNFT